MIYFADFYSAAMPAETIKANGYQGASVYASHQAGKAATRAQVDSYRAAGLVVSVNFEDQALQCLAGFDQGVTDATFATEFAEGLGYPPGCCLFYSVDGLLYYTAAEIPAGDANAMLAYFDGINSVRSVYRTGVYGGISTVELVMGAKKAFAAWQTASGSDGQLSPLAALYQDELGSVFDQDRLEFDVPLWGLDDTVPAATAPPTPITTPKGTPDMIVVEAEGTEAREGVHTVTAGDIFVLGPKKLQVSEAVANAYCELLGQTPPWAEQGAKYRLACSTLAAIPNA